MGIQDKFNIQDIHFQVSGGGGGVVGVLPSKRLMGLCRWMGSHFHNWIDYNGVTFW